MQVFWNPLQGMPGKSVRSTCAHMPSETPTKKKHHTHSNSNNFGTDTSNNNNSQSYNLGGPPTQ